MLVAYAHVLSRGIVELDIGRDRLAIRAMATARFSVEAVQGVIRGYAITLMLKLAKFLQPLF